MLKSSPQEQLIFNFKMIPFSNTPDSIKWLKTSRERNAMLINEFGWVVSSKRCRVVAPIG